MTDPDKASEHVRKVKDICKSERLTFQRTRQSTIVLGYYYCRVLGGIAEKHKVNDVAHLK